MRKIGVSKSMKKVIALSTVLGMGALGMACGDASNVNVNVNKAVSTPVRTMTPTPAATMSPAANMGNSTMSNANSAVKPANTMANNTNAPK